MIAEEVLAEVRVSAEDSDVVETLDDYLQKKTKLYDTVKAFLNAMDKKAKPEELQAMAYELQPQAFALNENQQEWAAQLDQIKRFIKEKNLNEASRLVYGELEKRIKLITNKWQESNMNNHEDVSGLYEDMNIWLMAYETGVSIVQLYLDQMEDEKEDGANLEALVKELLEAQDIKTFVNVYRKIIPDDKEKQQVTADLIKELFALKNSRPDIQKGDKEIEDKLRPWMQAGIPEELKSVADRIKNKLIELVLAAENRVEKDNRDEYDKLLAAIKQAGDMKARMEIVRVRLPQYMTPETFGSTLKDLDDMKPLIMAIVQGKTALQEATPQIKGTFKEAAQFLTGLTSYYKLVDEATAEKIKADEATLEKELNKILKAAEHMASFNKPLSDALIEFAQALQKGEEPEEEKEEEPQEQQAPELDDVADIPETEIQVLEKAYSEWVSGFMTAKFLKVQADIFTALWGPIKQFAGKDKEALEQMERAINPATASKEEEEEASAPLDEQEASPQEEPQEPQEEKEEFKRSILEGLIVLKRHSTLIDDVLKLYQSQVDAGKVGSSEAFKKYGDGNPRNVIYKFANLIVKDINSILATIAELSPEEQKIAEALLEVEGEKFSDKLRLVKAVNKFVVGETDVLLKILKKTQERGATSQVQEPPTGQEQETQDAEQKSPEQETTDESLLREMDQNEALAIKEQALKVHDEMIKIKRFFPSAQPFDSEYSFDSVTKQMLFIIKTIKEHIATMSRFKDDKQITKTSLASAKEGLLIIKKSLIELLGLSDEGKPAAAKENDAGYTEEGQEAIETGEAEEPKPLDVTEFEIEDDKEEKQAKPMNIGLPANLSRFMTSSQFLMDAKVKGALAKFEPEQQQTLLKFISYLVGYMAPAKNPELNENKQVLITTFSKGLGYEYDEMVKFLPILNRVDPQTVKAVGDILKAGRTKVLFLLQKVSERMSEFNVYGSYTDSSRLKLIQGLNLALEKPEEEPGPEPPRPKLGDEERRKARRGTVKPFDGRAEGKPWMPGDPNQYYTNEERVLNATLLEKRLEKIIKNILNNRKQ